MKALFCCGAALVLLTLSASAQDNKLTIQPNELTPSANQKPPLQLSDEQRRKIQEALVYRAQRPEDAGQVRG